jgi:hypothetical protein
MADLKGTKDSFVHVEYFQPDYVFVRYPEDGRLYFTNHPVTKGGEKVALDVSTPEASANSQARYETLEELTKTAPRSAEGVKGIMSAHSTPARICQHYQIEGAVMNTDASCVFVPKERTLYISRGRPCEVGYDAVRI